MWATLLAPLKTSQSCCSVHDSCCMLCQLPASTSHTHSHSLFEGLVAPVAEAKHFVILLLCSTTFWAGISDTAREAVTGDRLQLIAVACMLAGFPWTVPSLQSWSLGARLSSPRKLKVCAPTQQPVLTCLTFVTLYKVSWLHEPAALDSMVSAYESD